MKNLSLVLLSSLVALVLAEGLTRMFYEPRSPEITAFKLNRSSFYQADDELGWIPKKNIKGKHDKSGSFESTFSTNSYGIRGKEISLDKRQGVTRIVVLGDSMAWGFGVN